MSSITDPRVKKLAATIVLAAGALAVDKVMIGPPENASAAAPEFDVAGDPDVIDASQGAVRLTTTSGAAVPANASGMPSAVADQTPRDARRILASRLADRVDPPSLDQDAQATAASDRSKVLLAAFGDPENWWDLPDAQPALDLDDDQMSARDRFAREARLTAVIYSEDGLGGARINGRFVPIGAVIEGFRLVAIGSRSAILAGTAGRVVLELERNELTDDGPITFGQESRPRPARGRGREP